MREFFYGIYDFGNGDFDVRRSGELPVMIFDNEADRANWINSPDEFDIEWEKEFGWYRKAITAEQARDALGYMSDSSGFCCDWIVDSLEANDIETIRAALGWDSFKLPVELSPLILRDVKLPKKYYEKYYDDLYDLCFMKVE